MKFKCPALLNNRAVSICEKYNLEPMKCCLDCENFNYVNAEYTIKKKNDGVVDSNSERGLKRICVYYVCY